jgi:hypothetical protein
MSAGGVFYLVLFVVDEVLALVLMLMAIWVRRLSLNRGVPISRGMRALWTSTIASFAVVLVGLPVVLVGILATT